MGHHKAKPAVFVALVHETLKTEKFETSSDLIEATKRAAARLNFEYDSESVRTAVDQVERVIAARARAVESNKTRISVFEGDPLIDKVDAKAMLATFLSRAAVAPAQNGHRDASSSRTSEHERAKRILWQGVLDQIERCEALEEAEPV
jgi:hypothetical protein